MKEFIEYILKGIVQDAEAVKVEERKENGNVNIKITVAPNDMGIVIGKSGKNIRNIRTLAKSKAIKDGIRVNIELLDPYSQNMPQ